ncbi:MAG TPA: hypothetical protein PKE29_07070 [Phycisphaerales bacterium]|nr:hypothetical protein [Phycisphaerales bacterium]
MPSPDDKPRRPLRIAPSTGDVVPSRPRPRREPQEVDENPSEEDLARFGDVTRTCPECRKEVFDDAAICYHCGHAFERTTAGSTASPRWIIITVIVLVLAFAIAALSGLF